MDTYAEWLQRLKVPPGPGRAAWGGLAGLFRLELLLLSCRGPLTNVP